MFTKLDVTSESFMFDPYPTLAQARDAGAVIEIKIPFLGKTFVATTYEAVKETLGRKDEFALNPKSVGKDFLPGLGWFIPRWLRILTRNMLTSDEPDHRRLRGLVDQAFQKQSMADLQSRIESICDELIEAFPKDEPFDFLLHFARRYPLAVISEILGLPDSDRDKFMRWAGSFTSITGITGIFKVIPAIRQLMKYFKQEFEECAKNPRPGLISSLVEVRHEGAKLDDEELVAMAFLLLFAGHETTTHLLSGALFCFDKWPQQRQRLVDDWSLLPSAVDEILRYFTPVSFGKPRYVKQDMDFFNTQLKRGQTVMPILASANCDPQQFKDPETFDIGRAPNPHVAFGGGIHYCLGWRLAKTEAEVALRRLLTRFPKIKIDVALEALRWNRRVGLRSMKTLPVRLD